MTRMSFCLPIVLAMAASPCLAAQTPPVATHRASTPRAAKPERPAPVPDTRPTGPFDNQLKKFSAPLSANGAK